MYGFSTNTADYHQELPTAEEARKQRLLEDVGGSRRGRHGRDHLTRSAVTGRCFDGKRPLDGFVLATHATTQVQKFEPLKVPRDFSTRKRFEAPGPLEPGGKYAGFEGQVAAAAALAAAAVAEARARAQGGSGGGSGGGGGGGGSGRVVVPGSVTGADTSVDATGKRYLTPGGGLAPGLNFTSTQRGALLGEEKLNIPGA